MATSNTDIPRNDSERLDGALANVLTGMGVPGKDKKLANSVRFNALLAYTELEQLYKNGLIRRYIDSIPETILRHSPTIKLGGEQDDPQLITAFDSFLRSIQFHHALREVIQLQRLYGGAGLVLLLDDGLPPEEPVDINRLRAFRGAVPLSRHELTPEDVTLTDWSKPTHYRISTTQRLTGDQTEITTNLLIHSSRVARFDGLYLPWNLRVQNTGWGMSCVEVIWDAFQNYEGALSGLGNLLSEGDLLVHKIPGLMQRIASGGEADIRKRLEINNLARSVYGSMVLDKEEELANLSRSLGNVADATEPFIRYLQAVTGWPASILMGDSPGGLGKEGRFEERMWASLVESWQEVYCRTAITEVFQYVLLAKEGPTRGRPPQDWEVHFPSVFTKTDEERTALMVQMAQADSTYVNLGVLDATEVRQSRFGKTEYALETELDDDVTQRLQAQGQLQFEQQLMGYDAQIQALDAQGAPPETAPPAKETKTATDSFERIDSHGLMMRITHTAGDSKAGYLVTPDGQRIDGEGAEVPIIYGPHRKRTYNLYKARFVLDSQLIEGPYVTGFASMKAAKQAVASFFPRQTVAGLTVVSPPELASLRAAWEAY